MPKDYRVTVRIRYQIDLGATDNEEAQVFARKITNDVFNNNFTRAECLTYEVIYAEKIKIESNEGDII